MSLGNLVVSNEELNKVRLEAMMSEVQGDDRVVVIVGFLDGGLSFYGPFDDPELAEEFITQVVNPGLPAHWAWMSDPAIFSDEPAHCGSCGSEGECKCGKSKLRVLKKPIEKELPASSAIFNENGRLIGEQLEIS